MTVRTSCAHCGQPMELTIDSDLNFQVKDEKSDPIIFVPDIDLPGLDEESIINAF